MIESSVGAMPWSTCYTYFTVYTDKIQGHYSHGNFQYTVHTYSIYFVDHFSKSIGIMSIVNLALIY